MNQRKTVGDGYSVREVRYYRVRGPFPDYRFRPVISLMSCGHALRGMAKQMKSCDVNIQTTSISDAQKQVLFFEFNVSGIANTVHCY